MSGARLAFAATAESLAGTRFRLHGRDQASGVDCVGLVALALARIGRTVVAPRDYGLRNRDCHHFLVRMTEVGFVAVSGPASTGDVVMAQPGPAQVHLLIVTRAGSYVHAHAGLGRVVITPGPLVWPELGCWRLGQD